MRKEKLDRKIKKANKKKPWKGKNGEGEGREQIWMKKEAKKGKKNKDSLGQNKRKRRENRRK